MYSYVKFKAFSFFYQKIIEIQKRGLVVSLGKIENFVDNRKQEKTQKKELKQDHVEC
jgi:hypothetical protein